MNRLVETKAISLVDTLKMIKKAKDPEPILKQVTAVSNMKLLYKQINASGDAIQIGKSIQILENKYFKLCFETTQIPKLINVLACSSVEALLLKLLIQSNMNAKLAVEWIH